MNARQSLGQLAIALPEETPGARALTAEQELAAARREGSLLLSAGAGSGKTSVLVERFVRSVLEDDTSPGRILAITFTERSAGELAERIRSRFLELGRRELARDTEAAFIGTFHGFCARLLRAHPLLAGLDPDFAILDEALAGRLRLDAFRAALHDFQAGENRAAIDLVAAFGADRLRSAILNIHAQLRSEGHIQPELPAAALGEDPGDVDREGARACALLDTLLRGFSRHYAGAKRARGALDFDDLELLTGSLLRERPALRSAWSSRFELLMVDEFQDTNPRQLAILAALQRDNLFTVGDELQSIYGFRHADVNLFRARRAELAARGATLALTHNFRSHPHLLKAINAIFAARFGEDYTPLVPGAQGDGGRASIELLLTDQAAWNDARIEIAGDLPPAPRWRQAEALLLAQRLADIVSAGEALPGDIAVLLRSLGDLPLYQRALEDRGLPTLASVGSFWGHQQISDLLAHLRALANPLDEVALYSTLASPLVGLRSDTLAHISLAARASRQGVWEMLLRSPPELRARLHPEHPPSAPPEHPTPDSPEHPPSSPPEHPTPDAPEHPPFAPPERPTPDSRPQVDSPEWERLQRFIRHFAHEREVAPRHTIAQLLRRAIDFSDCTSHLLSLPNGPRRLANVHKLLHLAARFEAQEGRDLRGFLDHVAHQLHNDALPISEPEAPAGDGENAIRLMTIHAAKGLEFPLVCLADLGRRPATARPDLLLDGPRLGLRLARLDGSPAVPTLHYEDLLGTRLHAEALEEQRIVYVALTRARDRLLLSAGVDLSNWPADVPTAAPIAWLAPALHPDLPALLANQPDRTLQLHVRGAPEVRLSCLINTPATLRSVQRQESRAPHCAPDPSPSPCANDSARNGTLLT
jgi:ATP-dependent exoDNAse (exonuclease V) beta subunit